MSIVSMMPNTCDLYRMVAVKGQQGGNAPEPQLMASGLTCSVQSAPNSKTMAYAFQERLSVRTTIYFPEDVGIEQNGNYRLVQTDRGKSLIFQVEGYGETTLGRELVWSADCSRVL